MAMVNSLANVKDSRWLQLEVCREYQRNKCSRPDTECKFAHPPANVEVQNGRVIACYDSIKGRCNREKPPCKYFHPPPHLKDQLLINGRNHLALKNALMQQMPLQPVLAAAAAAAAAGQLPAAAVVSAANAVMPSSGLQALYAMQQAQQRAISHILCGHAAALNAAAAGKKNLPSSLYYQMPQQTSKNLLDLEEYPPSWQHLGFLWRNPTGYGRENTATTNPYMTGLPTIGSSTFSPYLTPSPMMAGLMPTDPMGNSLSVLPTALVTPQKVARTDRLEVCREFQRGNCKRAETECRFAHPPEHVTVDSTEGLVTVCMDFVKGRCSREPCRYFHPPPHLQAQLKAAQSRANAAAMAFPGMAHAYTKRPALDKSGVPVYQPGTATYQQALAMQVQQPFVPVSYVDPCFISVAGHPTSVPRF